MTVALMPACVCVCVCVLGVGEGWNYTLNHYEQICISSWPASS